MSCGVANSYRISPKRREERREAGLRALRELEKKV